MYQREGETLHERNRARLLPLPVPATMVFLIVNCDSSVLVYNSNTQDFVRHFFVVTLACIPAQRGVSLLLSLVRGSVFQNGNPNSSA